MRAAGKSSDPVASRRPPPRVRGGASLGRAGKKVETTLAALREHPGGEGRPEALRAAADAVWAFLVQREAMGLRDRVYIVAHYGVPREVLSRLGGR